MNDDTTKNKTGKCLKLAILCLFLVPTLGHSQDQDPESKRGLAPIPSDNPSPSDLGYTKRHALVIGVLWEPIRKDLLAGCSSFSRTLSTEHSCPRLVRSRRTDRSASSAPALPDDGTSGEQLG